MKTYPVSAVIAQGYAFSFRGSVKRVRNLIAIYRLKTGPRKSGRRPVPETDILRAAVVLLHAAVEDLLRNVACYSIGENSAPAVLDRIPLLDTNSGHEPRKFLLGALAPHASKTVKALIEASVSAHYRSSVTFNSPGDIVRLLQDCNLDPKQVKKELPVLVEMTQRRHRIVHYGDKDPRYQHATGFGDRDNRGYQVAKPLSVDNVERWSRATERFARKVLDLMSSGEFSKCFKVSQRQDSDD